MSADDDSFHSAKMSFTSISSSDATVCAWCGMAEVDDILEDCDNCDLVKYCGDNCKQEHREQHEEECKKREAALHDKKLFTQPDGSHLGECPLCFLPLPLALDMKKSTMMGCCCKSICKGCFHANTKRESEGGLEHKCAFCREPIAKIAG